MSQSSTAPPAGPDGSRPASSPPGSLPGPVREELDHLARTQRHLAESPARPQADEGPLLQELVRMQSDLQSARADDKPALLQGLEHAQARLDQLRKGRPSDHVDPDSPYFGHLGLREDGRTSDIFIGRATRLGEGLRIVDWRNAPISRMFYRYDEGDEFEEEMSGRMRAGQVVARRTVHIDHGQLLRVGSTDGTWLLGADGWEALPPQRTRLSGGEGAALRAGRSGETRLGASSGRLRADKHLPDIAALIDPEQFALITGEDSGVVVLRGSAGSGKTTVALHRIAFLAWKDPRRFSPGRVLVVVWGKGMRDYVGHVLPALGVEGVLVTTWEEWAQRMVLRTYGNLLPRVFADDTPEPVVRIKLHPGVAERMQAEVRRHKGPATVQQAIEDWARVLTDRAALAEAMGADISEGALDRAMSWLLEQTAAVVAHSQGETGVDARLDAEDAALFLRLAQLRVGPLKAQGKQALEYSHVVLDEVQDFSPVEVQVLLGTTDKRRCVTLAGDVRQHISQSAGFSSWTGFLERIGVPAKSLATLEVSYRSTHQVTSFALQVLDDDHEPTPRTTREGPPVELFQFSDHGAAVAFLAQELRQLVAREPLANIALLTPDPELSRLYAQGLEQAEVEGVRLVEDQAFAFAPGIDVVEADQVKGLEFDYVVIIDASARWWPDSPHHRRLMHVAATRAVHQLWLTCVGSPSPILPAAHHG